MAYNETMTSAHPNILSTPDRFLNREISWLSFNERVLDEAYNETHPLLERLRFLSISASNLDEFYMVRVAGIKAQIHEGVKSVSQDGLTPAQQIKAINLKAAHLMHQQQECWKYLKNELANNDLHVINMDELNETDLAWLENYFDNEIFPVLTPIAVDPVHPFPFVPNQGFAIAMHMRHMKTQKALFALTIIPGHLKRFIPLPGKGHRWIAIEHIIEIFLQRLFPSYELLGKGAFRILRDSDLEIEEEAADLVESFESALKRRRRGSVIRLKLDHDMPNKLQDFLIHELDVHPKDVISVDGMVGIADLKELILEERHDLLFTPFHERFPERIRDFGGDCFAAIRNKDIIIHHPYESFDVVVQFIRQAAADPQVVAIKQTLYRTSSNSPIVKALIQAAEAGKSVTVVVELRARFDEEANLRWARDLERAGAQVIFGFLEYKTHAKASLVVRREGDGLTSYIHCGTGNYHPQTARIYTDLSFFSCEPEICKDIAQMFNFITGYASPKKLNKLALSPLNLRKTLIKHINDEIQFAQKGKPATIWAKMNSLVDPEIIDTLYAASQAGVEITLIIRGICCLRPGLKGLSENIVVKSIVGRYLEHSRIVCFGNGHKLPSEKAIVYITSADWMPRNFDWRVETLFPVTNPTVHEQVVEQVMFSNIKDTKQSWYMDRKGNYQRCEYEKEDFSAQEFFMNNPSLSGRGSALKSKKKKKK